MGCSVNLLFCLLLVNLTVVLSQHGYPGAPENPKAEIEGDGILIRWDPPENSKVPVDYYSIRYRTVGNWVTLVDRIDDRTWYKWSPFSYGTTYHFRVYSNHGNPPESTSSKLLRIETGDPYTSGSSDSSLGFIAISWVFVAFFFTLIYVVMNP